MKRGPEWVSGKELARRYGVSANVVKRAGVRRVQGMSHEARALLFGMAREITRKMQDGVYEPGSLALRARQAKRAGPKKPVQATAEALTALSEKGSLA